MELKGKLKEIFETKEVGSKGYKTRDFVVTTDEQYPQHILLKLAQDKCDILNQFKVGDNVEVFINLRGREWVNPEGNTKYFNEINAWKVYKINTNPAPTPTQQAIKVAAPFEVVTPTGTEEHDDLPF